MGMAKLDLMDELEKRRNVWVFDDFNSYTDAQLWTKGGASSTVANSDNVNGLLTLTTNAAQNGEVFVSTTRKNFLFATGKPLLYEARINFAELQTNQFGLFLGFSSALGAAQLVNTTGVPAASFSGVAIFKQAGDNIWRCMVSIGSTQTIFASAEVASPVTVDQILRIECNVVGSNLEASFYSGTASTLGGDDAFPSGFQKFRESASGFLKPITIRQAFSGAVKMQAGIYGKSLGSGNNAEVVNVDYMGAEQLR